MKIARRESLLCSIQTLFSVGSVGGMTDGQLLEEFLARRPEAAEAAFAALEAFHGPMVWSVCQSILPDSHAAEDAFQATFLILARKAGSIRHRDALGAWLFGVARRVAVRAKTSAGERRRHERLGAEMKATPTTDPSKREQLEVLHAEVDRLPEKYRTAVVHCHLEGRTHTEAARLLKCPVGTVSVRVARARELLRDRLTRRGFAVPVALSGVTLFSETASAAAIPSGLAESTIKFALHIAAGNAMAAGVVPAAVAQLTEGVIKTMSMSKLTVIAVGVILIGSVAAGVGLFAAGGGSPQAKPESAPAAAADDREAAAKRSVRNLRTISLAMHNYASASQLGNFPPAASIKDGKPLLSWRVALLPFLDQSALYNKFHFDEPWDSPHNKTLLDQMPDVYALVTGKDAPKHSTYYQVFVGLGAMFGGGEGTQIKDMWDGTSNAIMVVEAAKPVPWTKPEDLPFEKEKPLPELGGLFKEGFHVAFADGAALFLSKKLDPMVLRALITNQGGEVISADALRP